MPKKVTFTRKELFDLVWSKPVSRLAPDYGMSDVALAKKCRKHHIPLPPVGYWQKVRNGKKVTRPKLPRCPQGIPKKIILDKDRDYVDEEWRKAFERRRYEQDLAGYHERRAEHFEPHLAAWLRARDIRDFLEAAKSSRYGDGENDVFEDWVQWVQEHADRIDPLTSVKSPLTDISRPIPPV